MCNSWIFYLKALKRLRKNARELKETNEVYARKRKNGSYFLGKGISVGSDQTQIKSTGKNWTR